MKYLIAIIGILTLTACSFSEYVQSEKLTEGTNVDAYRTGCDIDRTELTAGYMQYDANQYYYPGIGATPEPTPTPSPVDSINLATSILLEEAWEHGCQTGRRDAVGADEATLMSIRDQITALDQRLALLEPTPTATPVPTATPTGN